MKGTIITIGIILLVLVSQSCFCQNGYLEVRSNPTGASLIINGNNTGLFTPCEISLKSGKSQIELRLAGYISIEDSIEIRARKKLIKKYNFNDNYGMIAIRAEPDADILINGSKVANKIYTARMAAGTYIIEAVKENFISQTKKVDIESNEEYIINFELAPENIINDKVKKKRKALTYSALFPGAGQSYLQGKGFPIILGVAAYSAIGGSILLNKQAVSSYDSYVLEMNETSRAGFKDEWKKKSELSRNLVYGAAGLWAINLLWVLAMPVETVLPQNLSLQGYTGIIAGQQGISLAYKF